MLDLSKLGTQAMHETDDSFFSFQNGHSILFSVMPNPEVSRATGRSWNVSWPGWAETRAEEVVMLRLRNLNIYPSLFFAGSDGSTQLRVIRPLAWNRTEIISYCIAVKGESPAERASLDPPVRGLLQCLRMEHPDDLVEFRGGPEGLKLAWSAGTNSGHRHWLTGVEQPDLGIKPVMTGTGSTRRSSTSISTAPGGFMLDGIGKQINREAGE